MKVPGGLQVSPPESTDGVGERGLDGMAGGGARGMVAKETPSIAFL